MDSKDDTVNVGLTTRHGLVVLVGDDRPRLMIHDARGRCIATLDDVVLTTLFDKLNDRAEKCEACGVRVDPEDHHTDSEGVVLCDADWAELVRNG